MTGRLYVSEPSVEALLSRNCSRSSFFGLGSSVLPKRIYLVQSKISKRGRIAVRCSLAETGGSVLSKELEFKPSFVEYLNALESVKIDRDRVGDTVNVDSRPRKKRVVKKIARGDDEASSIPEKSYKGESKDREIARVNSTENSFPAVREVKTKQNAVMKNFNGKRHDGDEFTFLDEERVAFKSLESEDDALGKKKVTKADKEDRIQKLAKCLNGADIDIPEWQFSKMMRSAQIKYTDYSIMRLVQILGAFGNWRRVLQVIDWMGSHERFKSHKLRYVYTAALNALCKARRPVEAFNLFRAMLDKVASYPDIVAYHSIAVTLGQAGHIKELFDVIDTMRAPPRKKFNTPFNDKWDPRLEPDVTVYNAVLNACVQRKNWEGAFWVLQQLRDKDQQPSCATYGLVMEVMLASGKYNLVHDFFKKVQKSYVPNALIYRVLVNTLWKEGKIEEAVMAVDEMEKRGIVGNAGVYYDLARCLCSAGRCDDALKQINKICRVANKPLVVTYTGLMQACIDAGHVESGAYIFSQMQKFCSPNIVTCNIMLKGFLDHGMYREAYTLFLKLLENGSRISEHHGGGGVVPDIYSFNTMLDACAGMGKWDDLEFVYGQMLRYGHHFNSKRHLRPVLEARRGGKGEVLEMAWKHLVESERLPPAPLVVEMVCKKLEEDDAAAALSCILADSQGMSRKSWSNIFAENGSRFQEATLEDLGRKGSENVAAKHLVDSVREFLLDQRKSGNKIGTFSQRQSNMLVTEAVA